MPRQTFNWFPDKGSQLDREPAVSVVKFGDGYESRTPMGINANPQKWTLRFTRAIGIAEAIEAFLEARGGYESFVWTNPRRQPGIYVCRKWSLARAEMGMGVVSCVFEQVFES